MVYPTATNPFPIGYQQVYPQNLPQQVQPQQYQQSPPQQNTGIQWVQGEAGAKSYLVAAGTSVMLMDSEASVFYIKSTDATGMPQPLRVFDYKERSQQSSSNAPQPFPTQDFVTREELEKRLSEIFSQQRPQKQPQNNPNMNQRKEA